MGLMGRRMINNGDAPNCIPYTDIDDIITSVNQEYIKSRDLNHIRDVSENMRDYLKIKDDFLSTQFYD
jgi:hypothetical protein